MMGGTAFAFKIILSGANHWRLFYDYEIGGLQSVKYCQMA
jgi:hypothetical protein